MDLKEILELIEVVDKSTLTKFSFEQENTKIKIEKKNGENSCISTFSKNEDLALRIEDTTEKKDIDNFEYIKSPLVGTFYNSPSPDKQPYIAIGDKVSKDQVIGIIEVMKVMNEVKCNYDGVVEEILINGNDTVEYGQNLVKIKIV